MIAPRSLGWRLAGGISAVTVGLAVLLAAFYQRQTHALLDRETKERFAALAQQVAAASLLGTLARSEELLAGPLDGAMSQPDVQAAAIFDADWARIASRSRPGARPVEPGDAPGACQPCALGEGRLRWVIPVASASRERAPDADPFFDGPPPAAAGASAAAGWLALDVATAGRAAAERRVTARGLLLSAAALLVALALALLVAQRLTEPLRALALATREIGKGRWDAPIPTGGTGEIAQLADDFRAMAGELATLDAENSRYRGRLEEMVASRTRELEEAYQSMKAMAEAKDQFVATVSHDFRSPLAVILGSVQSMLSDPGMPAEVRQQFLTRAERQCRRLGSLVNDLLDLARIENRETAFAPCPLGELLEECADAVRGAFEKRGVELRIEAPAAPVVATVDRGHVVRALSNLLDNALKFTPAAGRVTVALACRDGDVSLRVADTGPGIPEEERAHVFERFYQGRSGQALGCGSGLGLAIVAGVARRHGGRVSVVSGDGAGTTFELRLPLAPP